MTDSFRWVVAVAVSVCVALFGFVLRQLQADIAQSNDGVQQALMVLDGVREIDGLEWRAVAGVDVGEISESVDRAAEDLRGLLDVASNDHDVVVLRDRADVYITAVSDMLDALEAGDAELAEEIDESRVDPGFEAILDAVNDISMAEQADTTTTERTVSVLTWLSVGALAGALGGALWFMLGVHDRRRERAAAVDVDRRFRSLIEGSQDVITVVSDVDDLAVLSPSLGALTPAAGTRHVERVSDVLTPVAFEQWKVADDRLRLDGGRQVIEVSLDVEDRRTVHLEGHGSALIFDEQQRVWVWRDVTGRKELELELTHEAFHDSLTGVANRSLLHDRVEHALTVAGRSQRPVTVLFCDLDDFKSVNDSLGHAHGDELLRIITKRIQTCVRSGDTVARLGGDEFAILLEESDSCVVDSLAERLLATVSYEVELHDRTIFPSISIGIANSVPGMTTEQLLRNADLAMYAAKNSGKGRAATFEDNLDQIVSDPLSLQSDLKAALANNEFTLHYQPTVDLNTGAVEGVEALIRWTHPTRGDVRPDQFIQLAETSGAIIAIGRWVINEACDAAVQLQQRQQRRITMAVNLSPLQLRDARITEIVADALLRSGLRAEDLILEVTEGSLLSATTAVERLHDLAKLGVQIAVDDFGTGYSSINYLQALPISTLKIDRSFISGEALATDERTAFLHAIVGLAKSLKLRSVAEGVEDAVQLHELADLGCEVGQGYFWSPATPLQTTQTIIETINARTARDTSVETSRKVHAEHAS